MKTCQLAIIGGGPAGYTAAEAAGKAGLDVVLFEKQSLGGVCLNEGCIPTKTLLYSAKVYDSARHAGKYAVAAEGVSFDLPRIIARKQKVVRKLVLGVKAKLAAAGVTVVAGTAEVLDRNHVRCGDDVYECAHLLLCTGSETVVPPIPGVADVPYWTHREALECKELPASLVVVGGGVIGMEFASFFNSLGTKVTVVEMAGEILGGMDGELAALLRAEYAKRGIAFHLQAKVARLEQTGGGIRVHLEGDCPPCVEAERLLLSVGRRPALQGAGLENLPLERDARGYLVVDGHMRTSLPGVYACGDLTGFSLLAHTAVREAEVAVHDILGRDDRMDYRAIPAVVYTNPEVAGVGARHGLPCGETAHGLLRPFRGGKRRGERRVQSVAGRGRRQGAGGARLRQPSLGNHHLGRHGHRAWPDGGGVEARGLPAPYGGRDIQGSVVKAWRRVLPGGAGIHKPEDALKVKTEKQFRRGLRGFHGFNKLNPCCSAKSAPEK